MNRTTHRSTAGTKLYAKRKSGKFTDIQTQRCASLDAIVAAWDAGHANEPPKPASYIRGLPAKVQR